MLSTFFSKDSGLLWLFGCPGRPLHQEEDGRLDYGSSSWFQENLVKLCDFSDLHHWLVELDKIYGWLVKFLKFI